MTKKNPKTHVLRARVTIQMKEQWNKLVAATGESEAFHLRAAVRDYADRNGYLITNVK